MRCSYFLLLVLVTIAATVHAGDNILQTNSLTTNSEPAIGRNLKGSDPTETSTAVANALKKSPSFKKLAKENEAIPKLMQKQPSLAKQLEDPKIATAVDSWLSNPSVIKSFKESKEVQNIAERVPTMSKEITPAQVEKMGEAAAKTTFLSRGISDAGQQLTAWTLAVVAAIIIFIIGWNMARNN